MIYHWCMNAPQKDIMKEMKIRDPHSISRWCKIFRRVCCNSLQTTSIEIGGFDFNGESIVVEIDETKFFHRKYHRGTWRHGHWVFGGIERVSKKCFLVEVPNRCEETLKAIILERILPGTTIMTDGWAAYRNIGIYNGGIYDHQVVIHQRNFVNPENLSIHTQNVENMWMRIKSKMKKQFGTSDNLFPSYLEEFMWRNKFSSDKFGHFLCAIANDSNYCPAMESLYNELNFAYYHRSTTVISHKYILLLTVLITLFTHLK